MSDRQMFAIEQARDLGWVVDIDDATPSPESLDIEVEVTIGATDEEEPRLIIVIGEDDVTVTMYDGRDGRTVVRATIEVAGSVDASTYF
jgi:hypothetical protein